MSQKRKKRKPAPHRKKAAEKAAVKIEQQAQLNKKKIIAVSAAVVAVAAAVTIPVLVHNSRSATAMEEPAAAAMETAAPVEETPEAEEAVSGINGITLTDSHIAYLSGENGRFNPDDGLTRADFACSVYTLLSDIPEETLSYGDVSKEAEYKKAVEATASLGLYPNCGKFFRPTAPITRAEAVYALGLFFPDTEEGEAFSDVDDSHFAASEIRSAKALGWIEGDDNDEFRPDEPLTRAEAAALFNRILQREADENYIASAKHIRCYSDVGITDEYYGDIMEASTSHEADTTGSAEKWTSHDKTNSGMISGRYFINGYLYEYSGSEGNFLRSTESGTYLYDEFGHYTSGNEELDSMLHRIISSRYDYELTQEENLRIFYEYTRDSFTYLRRAPYSFGTVDWWLEDAYNMLTTGYGNCYSYAATFYYFARMIGYDAVVYSGTVGSNAAPHGWVEIEVDGVYRVFDTELDMAYRLKGKFLDIFYNMDPATKAGWAYVHGARQ